MKTIFGLTIMVIILSASSSFAGELLFPGANHQYFLSVYKDHITIWGPGLPDCAPGLSCIWAHNPTATDMAVRNAWIAVLLQAITTGVDVRVEYSDVNNNPVAAPPFNKGSIIGVHTLP